MSFVAFVEGPLFNPFGAQKSGLRQDLEMLAYGRLRDPKLLGDQRTADAVGNEIAVDLRSEMLFRMLQPFQDQSTPFIGKRPQGSIDAVIEGRHIAN